jgi:hypothetical protein
MTTKRHKWKQDTDFGRVNPSSKTCVLCGLKAFYESAYGLKFVVWTSVDGKEHSSLSGDKMPKCVSRTHFASIKTRDK